MCWLLTTVKSSGYKEWLMSTRDNRHHFQEHSNCRLHAILAKFKVHKLTVSRYYYSFSSDSVHNIIEPLHFTHCWAQVTHSTWLLNPYCLVCSKVNQMMEGRGNAKLILQFTLSCPAQDWGLNSPNMSWCYQCTYKISLHRSRI